MSYGPAPWRQASWDWRAAGNFVCGGAGGGLIFFAAVSGARGIALGAMLLGGMALVGCGLACVWFELGRPLRALHVFLNPRTSWMSREGFVASLLMPVTLLAALGLVPGLQWVAAALALAFIYCQSRMVQAARGIPAWREPLTVPLMLLTGLAEGGGLALAATAALGVSHSPAWLALVAAVWAARLMLWRAYRRRLATLPARRASAALDAAGGWLSIGGSALPLALLAAGVGVGGAPATLLLGVAGLLAAATGMWFKFTLITRAGFNQGFALRHLPVRGVPR